MSDQLEPFELAIILRQDHSEENQRFLSHIQKKVLLIDCRRFIDYNSSHVKSAINVCCSKLIRRRLSDNKLCIVDLLHQRLPSSEEAPSVFCPSDIDVIVYDQASEYAHWKACDVLCSEGSQLPTLAKSALLRAVVDAPKSDVSAADTVAFVRLVMEKLKSAQFRSVKSLRGGFLEFQASFPDLCESGGASSEISATTLMSTAGESKASTGACSGRTIPSRLSMPSLSQPCLPVSNVGPTRILPFLYLGSQQDAMDQETMKKFGIDHVLNMSMSGPKPDFIQEDQFLRIPVNDTYTEKLLPYFEKAFAFIDNVRESNACALIHCLAGISRSPTLAIAYVMHHCGIGSEEAYRFVKDRRPTISPNFNFLGQLLEYEKQISAKGKENLEAQGSFVGGGGLKVTTVEDLLFSKPGQQPSPSCAAAALAAPILGSSMRRSASVPFKIQKIPDKTGLRLDFGSPEQRTNKYGKREMCQDGFSSSPLSSSSDQTPVAVIQPSFLVATVATTAISIEGCSSSKVVHHWAVPKRSNLGLSGAGSLTKPTRLAGFSLPVTEEEESERNYFTLPAVATPDRERKSIQEFSFTRSLSHSADSPTSSSMDVATPVAFCLSDSPPDSNECSPTNDPARQTTSLRQSVSSHFVSARSNAKFVLAAPPSVCDLPSPSTELAKLTFEAAICSKAERCVDVADVTPRAEESFPVEPMDITTSAANITESGTRSTCTQSHAKSVSSLSATNPFYGNFALPLASEIFAIDKPFMASFNSRDALPFSCMSKSLYDESTSSSLWSPANSHGPHLSKREPSDMFSSTDNKQQTPFSYGPSSNIVRAPLVSCRSSSSVSSLFLSSYTSSSYHSMKKYKGSDDKLLRHRTDGSRARPSPVHSAECNSTNFTNIPSSCASVENPLFQTPSRLPDASNSRHSVRSTPSGVAELRRRRTASGELSHSSANTPTSVVAVRSAINIDKFPDERALPARSSSPFSYRFESPFQITSSTAMLPCLSGARTGLHGAGTASVGQFNVQRKMHSSESKTSQSCFGGSGHKLSYAAAVSKKVFPKINKSQPQSVLSTKLRSLLKRASWPNAVPFFFAPELGEPSGDTSRATATEDVSRKTSTPLVTTHAPSMVSKVLHQTAAPSHSAAGSPLISRAIGKQPPKSNSAEGLVFALTPPRFSGLAEHSIKPDAATSLLFMAHESNFMERTLFRDPERDSLGSTSSLEITVN